MLFWNSSGTRGATSGHADGNNNDGDRDHSHRSLDGGGSFHADRRRQRPTTQPTRSTSFQGNPRNPPNDTVNARRRGSQTDRSSMMNSSTHSLSSSSTTQYDQRRESFNRLDGESSRTRTNRRNGSNFSIDDTDQQQQQQQSRSGLSRRRPSPPPDVLRSSIYVAPAPVSSGSPLTNEGGTGSGGGVVVGGNRSRGSRFQSLTVDTGQTLEDRHSQCTDDLYGNDNYVEIEHQLSNDSIMDRRKKKRSVLSLSCQRWIMKIQMLSQASHIALVTIISMVISTIIFLVVVGVPGDSKDGVSLIEMHEASRRSGVIRPRLGVEDYYLEQSAAMINPVKKGGSERNNVTEKELSTIEAERLNSIILGGGIARTEQQYASRQKISSSTPRIVQVDDLGRIDNHGLSNVNALEPRVLIGFLSDEEEPTRPLNEKYLELRQTNPKLLKQPDSLDKGDCQAVAPDWQLSHHPTCVSIHEASAGWQHPYRIDHSDLENNRTEEWDISTGAPIDSDSINEQLRYINAGSFRQVWMIRDADGVTKRAMKTLRVDSKSKKFDLRNFDRHRRDAVAFDQLQYSPYVVNIHGHCANTAIFDYADGGDLLDVFTSRPNISKSELLQIAYNISLSVHHGHNFDEKGRPTMAHTDIKTDQFILQDGYYKLSDFNRVRFLMWNEKRDLPCGFRVEKNGGEYRSPEEYAYQVENEKVDVYSLGNVLYFLLTQEEPWEDYKLKHVYELVKMGQRPKIPDEIRNNTGVFEQTMIQAMEMAWIHDRSVRPPALDIAKKIKQGLSLM